MVKDYRRLITAEQLQARITPKQATLFFVDKLTQLSFHLDQKLPSEDLSPSQCFIVARDQAYFKCVFFSGDRPGDLGCVKSRRSCVFLMMMDSFSIMSGERL